MTERELDFLVAEKVMGWINKGIYWLRNDEEYKDKPELGKRFTPHFSTSIEMAWEILNKAVWYDVRKFADGWYHVELRFVMDGKKGESAGEDLCIAICKAALEAV